jgi:hypothetical protein
MKNVLIALSLLLAANLIAQEQREDGTWWDNNLTFQVKKDLIRQFGELEICIYDTKRGMCVENLMTRYEVIVYNSANEEIWNSLWTGKNMNMKFSKALPDASYVKIRAMKPFAINKLTGTRIYMDEPMELKHRVK